MISAPPQVGPLQNCNGSTRQFDFPFRILADSDLRVLHVTADGLTSRLVLGTDYTVQDVGSPTGGRIVTTVAYPAGDKIRIWIDVPVVQPVDYVENDAFPAQSHEDALDRLTLIAAQARQDIGASVHAPLGDTLRDLPPAGERAKQFMGFDADGDVVVAPAIEAGGIADFDAARLYWDRNDDLQPRLVIDPGGHGSTALSDIANPGGRKPAVLAMQNRVAGGDFSGPQCHFSVLYQNWPDTETDKPRQRRSKGVFGIAARTLINAPFWETDPPPREGDDLYADWQYVDGVGGTWGVIPDNPSALYDLYTARIATQKVVDGTPQVDSDGDPIMWSWGDTSWTPRYLGQEVSLIQGNVTNAAGVTGGKIEALVIGARQEPSLLDADGNVVEDFRAQPCKGVALQAITVCAVKGPVPDIKTVLDDGDGDNSTSEDDQIVGVVPAMITVRLNGSTTGGFADSTSFHRSWAACGIGGRAGYVNGIFVTGIHSFPDDAEATDSYGVKGYGGVWGGRSFWHSDTMAIYAKDDCPGWLTLGHDGIPQSNPTGKAGVARAPIDVVVDTATDTPAQWTANQAVVMFNGAKLLGARVAGHQKLAGSSTTDAHALNTSSITTAQLAQIVRGLQEALIAHGLIGT